MSHEDKNLEMLEPRISAPKQLRKNVESNLNFIRLVGALLHLFTSLFFSTLFRLVALMLPSEKKKS